MSHKEKNPIGLCKKCLYVGDGFIPFMTKERQGMRMCPKCGYQEWKSSFVGYLSHVMNQLEAALDRKEKGSLNDSH